jgi:ABC-type multidrug transport system permease subunit
VTPRHRATAILALLIVLCVAVPTVLAYQAGFLQGRREYRQLEQRINHLETSVSLLQE